MSLIFEGIGAKYVIDIIIMYNELCKRHICITIFVYHRYIKPSEAISCIYIYMIVAYSKLLQVRVSVLNQNVCFRMSVNVATALFLNIMPSCFARVELNWCTLICTISNVS